MILVAPWQDNAEKVKENCLLIKLIVRYHCSTNTLEYVLFLPYRYNRTPLYRSKVRHTYTVYVSKEPGMARSGAYQSGTDHSPCGTYCVEGLILGAALTFAT
jgi:hypothetical protein